MTDEYFTPERWEPYKEERIVGIACDYNLPDYRFERILKMGQELETENAKLKEQLVSAREVIALYSSEDNIVLAGDEQGFEETDIANGYWCEFGKRAREWLEVNK